MSVKLGPEGTSRALVSSPVPFPDREYSESDDGVWSVALAVTRGVVLSPDTIQLLEAIREDWSVRGESV